MRAALRLLEVVNTRRFCALVFVVLVAALCAAWSRYLVHRYRIQTRYRGWRTNETAHFILYIEPGSPAERAPGIVRGDVESHFAYLAAFYQCEPDAKIRYFLHNADVLWYAGDRVLGCVDYAGVHVVYSDHVQDRSMHELHHFFQQVSGCNAPRFFREGTCGIGSTIGNWNPHHLAKFVHGTDRPLKDHIEQFGAYGDAGNYVAFSFCDYLCRRCGPRVYLQFINTVDMANYASLLKTLAGVPFEQLESEWRAHVEAVQVPSLSPSSQPAACSHEERR